MRAAIQKHATAGLACSAEAAQFLFGPQWRSDLRFRVFHCGINLEPFRSAALREEARRELGIPADAPVVGHVGQFIERKNHAFLLKVALEVLKLRPEVRFLMVGDGPLRPQIESMARASGIEKNVIFTGQRSDIPRLMLSAMDVFAFPSIEEGLPIALTEAQAAGLRSLSSAAITFEAGVVPGAVEYLSLSEGPKPWAAHLLRMLESGSVERERALCTLEQSDFNIHQSCSELTRMYELRLAMRRGVKARGAKVAQTICVDGSFLSRRYFGTGVHTYATNLLQQMERLTAQDASIDIRVLVPPLDEMEGVRLVHRPGFELTPCPSMRYKDLWRLGLFMLAAKRLRPDVLFLPFPHPIYFKAVRLAIMVHDVIPLLPDFRRHSLRAFFFRQSYSSSLRRADLILTNSERSKADKVSVCGIAPERIQVIYLGFDPDVCQSSPTDGHAKGRVLGRYGIDAPYILWVGKMEPRKNLVRLVQAYNLLLKRRKDIVLQLVLCGGQNWGCENLNRLLREPANRGHVIWTGPVPNSDLSVLYREAMGFAMPSLYEGFGLPTLEAMASGIPVISSNRSSLPEIAGNAALFFDPESVEEMSTAMERLLSDAALRQQLVALGRERVKQFSWEACARATLAALRSL
jgi:glycosyltransferase involved in cell wall biosynthesis